MSIQSRYEHAGSTVVQEYRSTGVQEYRSTGVQEYRSTGVQEYRSTVDMHTPAPLGDSYLHIKCILRVLGVGT
jgi:hypothetical protein